MSSIRVAYADPPYLGEARKHYRRHHPEAWRYDLLETHKRLIHRLYREFPDGWALSLKSTNLQEILPLCPPDVRVGSWCKAWTPFNRQNPVYAWEPVIFRGGRPRANFPAIRDYLVCQIAMRTGLVGAKPRKFCYWMFDLLNLQPGDTLVDLFPGSGSVRRAWSDYKQGIAV